MSLKRKVVVGVLLLVVAAAATGGAIAARAGVKTAPVPHLQGKSLLGAASIYLGIPLAQLKHEITPNRPLDAIANATAGRTAAGLRQTLDIDAFANLRHAQGASRAEQRANVHAWLRRKIAGFVAGTCPLKLGTLFKRLGGSCPGMQAGEGMT